MAQQTESSVGLRLIKRVQGGAGKYSNKEQYFPNNFFPGIFNRLLKNFAFISINSSSFNCYVQWLES